MKPNITHKILVLISKEANKQGFNTELTYNHDEWVLYIFDKEDAILFDRNTKISDLEDWMKS